MDLFSWESRKITQQLHGLTINQDVGEMELAQTPQLQRQIYVHRKNGMLSWNSTGPTPTLGMRLSRNFVNVYTIAYRVQYTFTNVHAPIPNWHPREDHREEKRASDKSARIVVRVRLEASWTGQSPDTPTSSRRFSRGSRRGCPCRCPCPCRSRGIPALLNSAVPVET